MHSIWKSISQALVFALVIFVLPVTPSYGWDTYSGSSVGSNGTTYGWGVTNVPQAGYLHTAYVTTTLTSPKGRTISSGWRSATTSVRADVSLSWDATDEGTYLVKSTHKGYCRYICWFIYGVRSSSFVDIGHSENWYKFNKPWEYNTCQYVLIAGCVASCQNPYAYQSAPCSNGSDSKAYLRADGYYWRLSGSGTRYCIGPVIEKPPPTASPGTCKDVD